MIVEEKIHVGDIKINTRIEGPSGAPWVTFCHSLATDLTMFDEQAVELTFCVTVIVRIRRRLSLTAPR